MNEGLKQGIDEPEGCQLACYHSFSQGSADYPPLSWFFRIKLIVKKRLSPKQLRSLKKYIDAFLANIRSEKEDDYLAVDMKPDVHLVTGDLVRILSRHEIKILLNRWKETKHCGFMDGMWDYCDTIQVVKQPVRRFVEERTLKVKKTRGIVILEDVFCAGTSIYGRCDRSCYFFWREEWLEKIKNPERQPGSDLTAIKII